MGILEKIAEIEREISRTQKNKGTLIFYYSVGKEIAVFFETILLVVVIVDSALFAFVEGIF